MKLWHKKLIVFIFGIISLLMGQYLSGAWFHPLWSYECQAINTVSGMYCNSPFFGIGTFGLTFVVLGGILTLIGFTSLLVGFFLLFAKPQVFQEWLKFSYWYIPIAIFIILTIYSGTMATFGGDAPIIQGINIFMEPYIVITAYIVATDLIPFAK